MSDRVEDGVKVFPPDAVESNGLVERSLRSRILFKPEREVGKLGSLLLLSRSGRPPSGLNSGILENIVRSGKLLQSEACLSSGVAELVVVM